MTEEKPRCSMCGAHLLDADKFGDEEILPGDLVCAGCFDTNMIERNAEEEDWLWR